MREYPQSTKGSVSMMIVLFLPCKVVVLIRVKLIFFAYNSTGPLPISSSNCFNQWNPQDFPKTLRIRRPRVAPRGTRRTAPSDGNLHHTQFITTSAPFENRRPLFCQQERILDHLNVVGNCLRFSFRVFHPSFPAAPPDGCSMRLAGLSGRMSSCKEISADQEVSRWSLTLMSDESNASKWDSPREKTRP